MAETKKRNTNQKNNSKNNGKSNRRSSNRNDSSNASGPDLLTIVVVIIAVILVGALIMNYKKEREGEKEAGTTPAATATQPPKKETPGLTEEPESTKKPTPAPTKEPTPAPTKEPAGVTKEPEPTDAPVPTEEVFLPRKEAEALLTARIDTSLYQTELLSDHLPIDGKTYYLFCINDKNGKTYEPLVIVEKKKGAIFYYDAVSGTISDFLKFPLDATEPQGTGDKAITKEEAVEILKGFSAEKLGLAMELTKYQMEPDDWSTTVETKECYGINVFEVKDGKKRLRGTFYVANDGKNVFKLDSERNEFIEIKK